MKTLYTLTLLAIMPLWGTGGCVNPEPTPGFTTESPTPAMEADDDDATSDQACPQGWVLVEPPEGGTALLGQPVTTFMHNLDHFGDMAAWGCEESPDRPNACGWADLVERQEAAVPLAFCMPRHPFPGAGEPWVTSMTFALSTTQVQECLWPAAQRKYGVLPPTLSEFQWAASGGADPDTGEPRNLPYAYGDVWNLGRAPGAYDDQGNWYGGDTPVCTRDPDHHPDRLIGESTECCNALGICELGTRGGMVAFDASHCGYEEVKRQYQYSLNPENQRTVDLRCDEIGDRYETFRVEEVYAAVTGAYTHRSVGYGPPPTTGPSFSAATHFGIHFHGNDAAPFDGHFVDDTGIWLITYPGHWTQEGIDSLMADMHQVAVQETWHVLWRDLPDLSSEVCDYVQDGARDENAYRKHELEPDDNWVRLPGHGSWVYGPQNDP